MERLKRKLCDLVVEAQEAQAGGNAAAPAEALQPLKLSRRENWKALQFRDTPKYLCYRGPSAAAPKVPIQLLHPSFIQFCSDLKVDLPQQQDMEMAATLCALLSEGFDSDLHFKSLVRSLLWVYFGTSRSYPMIRTEGDEEVGGGMLDGVLWRGHPVLVLECRLERDPWFQSMALLHQYFATQMPREKTSHTLLLLLTGISIMAVAVAWDSIESKLLAEPLTDYLTCSGPCFSTQPKLAAMLAAAKRFVEEYSPSREVEIDARIPWCVRDWAAERLESLVFRCSSHPRQRNPVVAKLCRNYSSDAHKGWHQQGIAPQLLEEEEIGGGWKVCVIEYLNPDEGWMNGVDYAESLDQDGLLKLQGAVRDAAERGHKSGFCHGDFRLENIMVKSRLEDIKAVDFEFSGRTSVDRYPGYLGSSVQWHEGAGCGKTLEEEHDYHFVDKIVVDYSKSSYESP